MCDMTIKLNKQPVVCNGKKDTETTNNPTKKSNFAP